MKYQGQFAKQTPITRTRMTQLTSERYADEVMKVLLSQSELKGHVSRNNSINLSNKEFATYDTLANAINKSFTMKKKIDIHKVANYLKDFFDMLIGDHSYEFIDNPSKTKKTSIINENTMFAGYIKLASRMYENNIEAIKVLDYMGEINFSRDNSLWKEIGYLDQKGKLNNTEKAKQKIEDYFQKFNLE